MKLTISKKMYGAFGIISISVLIFAVFVINLLHEYKGDVKDYSVIQRELILGGKLQFNTANVWQFFTDASLTKDEEVITKEAKIYFDKAMQNIEELKENNAGNIEYTSKLDELKGNLQSMWNTGYEMFKAYSIDWNQGNKEMEKFDVKADKVINAVKEIVKNKTSNGESAMGEMLQMSSSSTTITIIVAVIVLLFGVLTAFVISRHLTVPIRELNNAATKVSSGNINVSASVKNKDELGNLANSFNIMVASIKKGQEDVLAEKASVERKVEEAVRESEEQRDYLSHSVEKILIEMNNFEKGDLTVELAVEKEDEIGRLFQGFNRSVENIRNMMLNVSEAVQATTNASTQISSSTEEMSAGAQEQSAQTSEVASAVEQMTKTILETSQNIGVAAEMAQQAGNLAGEGGKVVESTVTGINKIAEVVITAARTVEELGKSSDQIGEIVQVIDDIADQTNLLALNAAIEAARAGEQGRGFAVVADEVRKLAERTTKATKEIAEMIKHIQKNTAGAVESIKHGTNEVEIGKQLAGKAGESLHKIIDSTLKVTDSISLIATASEEQSTTAEQISKNIESMNSVTQEAALGIQQIARGTEDLNGLTINLQGLVGRFNLQRKNNGKQLSSGTIFNDEQKINNNVNMAISAHKLWKTKIHQILNGELQMTESNVLSHRECQLGKLYYSQWQNIFEDHPSFDVLGDRHEEMHNLLKDTIKLYNDGHLNEAKKFAQRIYQLSDEVVSLLNELRVVYA